MKMMHLTLTAGTFLAPLTPCFADPVPFIHYLEERNSDVAVIDRAGHEIDMAAYELRDWTIIQALIRAADRGVKAHIYRDGVLADSKPLEAYLAKRPGVEIQAKPSAAACPAAASPHTIRYMHLRPRARQLTQYVKRSSARVALVPSCGVEAALESLIESGLGRTVRGMAQAPASGLRGRLKSIMKSLRSMRRIEAKHKNASALTFKSATPIEPSNRSFDDLTLC